MSVPKDRLHLHTVHYSEPAQPYRLTAGYSPVDLHSLGTVVYGGGGGGFRIKIEKKINVTTLFYFVSESLVSYNK